MTNESISSSSSEDNCPTVEIYYQLVGDKTGEPEKKHLGTYNRGCLNQEGGKSPFEERVLKVAKKYFLSQNGDLTNQSVNVALYSDDDEVNFTGFNVAVTMHPKFDAAQLETNR